MIRQLLLVFLIFSSFTVSAKKLYKYQDEEGKWHFTDRPTQTGERLEVRQLKVTPKQMVWLQQSGEERHPKYYIRNDYTGPIEVEISFTEQKNVRATPDLPRRFVVEPGNSETLLAIDGIDPYQPWRMGLKYNYVIGKPLHDYRSPVAYLPPIEPGASFRVSQAFGGSFSHNDEQNQYAADIVMPIGTPVHAARSGTVLEADDDYFKGGANKAYSAEANSIRILHDDGSMAIYAHLQLERAQVYPGMTVSAGQLIGYSGNTGFSTGPHLHFAVQINGGMKLVSVPFAFINRDGLAEEPTVNAWLKGFSPSEVGNLVE